jgi:hypothetical protein
MFRATFGKIDRQNAQYYYKTAYRRRTLVHRRGWLRPSKFGRCAGVLLGPFLFSKPLICKASDLPNLLTAKANATEESR